MIVIDRKIAILMGIKLSQLEARREVVRDTGFEPVTPTVSM